MTLRCVIVDDNERFLEAAAARLSGDGMEVLGTATTSAAALELTERVRPNVVLVDISLGDESGFDVARRLVEAFPDLTSSVVLISTRSEEEYARLAAESGAAGFLPKLQLSAQAVLDLVSANR